MGLGMDDKQKGYIDGMAKQAMAGIKLEDQADVAAQMLHLLSDNLVPAKVFRDAPWFFSILDPGLLIGAVEALHNAGKEDLAMRLAMKADHEERALALLDGGSDD